MASNAQIEKRIAALETKVAALTARVGTLETQLVDLTGRVAALEADPEPEPEPEPSLEPVLQQDLNGGSWASTWDQSGAHGEAQIADMEFANGFTHPGGRQLEFCTSNHSRAPGNNTGVRWAEFSASGAPSGGYYWPNDDLLIYESDNLSTYYLPWRQWCIAHGFKIIDISGPSAVKRWPSEQACSDARASGNVLDMSDVIDYVLMPANLNIGAYRSNYNPAVDQNPSGAFTFSYGGGYWNSYPNGIPSVVRIIDDNPNYPETSTKPLRMRVIAFNAPSPTHMHHGARVGNYFYWGAADYHNDGSGNVTWDNLKKFYRVKLSDLADGIITQEALPDMPLQLPAAFGADGFRGGWKYGLLCADTERKKVIYVGGQGVCRYSILADETQPGTWEGPYTFGMTAPQWCNSISDGHANLTDTCAGFIGTHRADLNKTFFRYNRSKKWHRISWSN